MALMQGVSREKDIVLSVENLSVNYVTKHGDVPAVRDVSFRIRRGEALGLVGESGCGKSTTAMTVMAYLGSNAGVVNGSVTFEGQNLLALSDDELRAIRGNRIA